MILCYIIEELLHSRVIYAKCHIGEEKLRYSVKAECMQLQNIILLFKNA